MSRVPVWSPKGMAIRGQVLSNSLTGHSTSTGHETGIPYKIPYPGRDVRGRQGTGYRHIVHCYDYVSDNLAGDFGIRISRNVLIIRGLRQI